MSGGELNYLAVKQIADQIEEMTNRAIDKNTYHRLTLHYMASIWLETQNLARKIKALDYLDGGDIGEEEFIDRVNGKES